MDTKTLSAYEKHKPAIYKWRENNKEKYDRENEYNELDWDVRCGKIREDLSGVSDDYYTMILEAISNKYKKRITIHNFNINKNGTYEAFKVKYIGNSSYDKIYLRKSNNNHFDLMKKI